MIAEAYPPADQVFAGQPQYADAPLLQTIKQHFQRDAIFAEAIDGGRRRGGRDDRRQGGRWRRRGGGGRLGGGVLVRLHRRGGRR
ncbi:MAG: hypothetical protein EA396_01665 [Anaerolineaceae bacterium]|nr:MAG: hypothetical protein EA396_01665 [Anaerolineaceae bacterium]